MSTLSRRAELYAPGLGREKVRRLLRVAVYLVMLVAAVGGGSSPSLVLADFFFRPFIFFIFLFALLLTFRARRTIDPVPT